jgi:IS4 transposase
VERIEQWLQPKRLEEQARQTKFMRRKPKKLTPLLFVQTALLLVGQSGVSLSRWAVLLGVLSGSRLSKQSVWERINSGAVCFLQQVLGLVLAQRVTQKAPPISESLQSFSRVLIQDSTTFKLAARLAAFFPGSRNQCGAKHGQLKIQATYELLTQRFLNFSLSGFNRNDQAAASDVLALLQKGDLVLRDLGYFAVETFREIVKAQAFFLSRLRLDTTLFDPKSQQPIDLLKQLKRYGQLDIPVLFGQQKLSARLVAIKLPEPVAAQRRRKANQNRDRRCQPNCRHLALLGWAIFVTNVDRQRLSAKEVAKVYGLRWRIETIFKAWKSHFRITAVPPGSQTQLLAVIYARLIFITVMAELYQADGQAPWKTQSQPSRSLLKTAALLGDFFLSICLQEWQPRLQEAFRLQLDYHCRYERRTRQNFVENLLKLT